MQCNPGVAFIPKPMTAGAVYKHPLNRSGVTGGEFSYLFYAPSPRRVANQQSTQPISKEKPMKRNLIRLSIGLMTVLFSAMTAIAQTPGGAQEGGGIGKGLGYIGAGVGFGIAAGLCGIGQGRVAAAACEGMARNPGAYNRVQLALILGLAFIETLVLFSFVIVYIHFGALR
jgi:F-type H+-transporting ATPase subunit c